MNEKYYGFIYITTNLINGKKYIGQKKYDTGSRWKSYLGSGLHLGRAIKKYGKENFKREIIDYALDKEHLNELEYKYIKMHNAVEDTNYYNSIEGGTVLENLVLKNSVPIVNIDSGYVFKSVSDASKWSGISELKIRESYNYKHNPKEKVHYLLFRKLSDFKFGTRPCLVCGFRVKNGVKFCTPCSREVDSKLFGKFTLHKNELCNSFKDKWVYDYAMSNYKVTKRIKLKVMNKPLSIKYNAVGKFKK